MKYNQYKNKRSKNGGLVIVIAVCLLIVGGAAWFALAQLSQPESASPKEEVSEYKEQSSAYNSSESQPIETPAESTAKPVESQPYSSNETTEEPKKETHQSFSMPVQGEILKEFSNERLQYSKTYGDMRLHQGVDIECEKGEAISSCSDGKVTEIEINTAMGNVITVDHGNGLLVKYASLDNIKVEKNDTVKTGDILGTASTISSECADKFHIHIEAFKNGNPVCPLTIMGFKQ